MNVTRVVLRRVAPMVRVVMGLRVIVPRVIRAIAEAIVRPCVTTLIWTNQTDVC